MNEISLPQLLIIAGTGRNTGKTTLACNIIRKCSSLKSIFAIKITPHFHENIQSREVITDNENYYIAEETDFVARKDSSLMLNAGALKSYFVMVKDEYVREAFSEILKLIPSDTILICESGGLRKYVTPGLFLMMRNTETISFKHGTESLMQIADRIITFDGENIDFDFNTVEITDNRWTLKQI